MDISQFQDTNSGRLVPTIEGMRAFVPNQLPPELNFGNIIGAFGEASDALGGLREIGNTIANPYMVISPLQRNEALRSSAMEGTFSTADDLVLAEVLDERSATASARDVHNYIRAINFALNSIKKLPISHRLIKEMHAILLAQSTKVRGSNKHPGEYKTHQNWIGARQIQKARFIPPPPTEAVKCMDELASFINSDYDGIPPLIAAGLSHYQFETIHPFGDGNGRVGRMLITLQLLDQKLLNSPLLYVSSFIEMNKDEYIDAMFAVSARGDWERWLRFFLTTVKESCVETTKVIGKLNALQKKYRGLLHAKSKSVSALSITDQLFARPVVSISQVAESCGISYQSAKKNVDQLVQLDILQQVSRFKNPKLYWAKEIIDISDGG